MRIVNRNPRTMSSFTNLVDEFMKNDPFQLKHTLNKVSQPAVNIMENEDSFSIAVAAPGLTKEDFKVKVDDDVLTISSEKAQANEEQEGKFSRKEFSFQKFERSFFLPENVDEEKIEAKYDAGILTLTLPKKEEAQKKLKEIKVA